MTVSQPGDTRPSRLSHARVSDAMHAGVLTCPPETPMADVARMMAGSRVHCVIVSHPRVRGKAADWGALTDLDLVAMLAEGGFETRTAGECAIPAALTVSADATLAKAAQLMAEHRVSHLVVLAAASGRPVGMLSTLDLAGVAAGLGA